MANIKKPMNPYATEDFQNAIKEASEKLNKMGEMMKERIRDGILMSADDLPYISFDDLEPEFCGTMRLNYCNGIGGWRDVAAILLAHGYEVTARVEDATETEKHLDKVSKWVVIEYGEVE